MANPRDSGLRLFVVAVLAFVLTLGSVGRGFAGVPSPADALSGVHVEICHSGDAEPQGPAEPAGPARHACCDACALLAPAVLPEAPTLSRPAPAITSATQARPLDWRPATARTRSPRQSRGPPTA